MKKFILRLISFVSLLLILQFIVYIIDKPENPEGVDLLKKYISDQYTIVGLGDSSVSFAYEKEENQESTYTILEKYLQQDKIGEIVHPAYHVGIYDYYFENIARNSHSIRLVVIPINLRSFSPQWDMRPAYQFKKTKTLLRYDNLLTSMLFKPLAVFKYFDPKITEDVYENTPVYMGEKRVGRVKDFKIENYTIADNKFYREKFIYHYMYNLTPTHRKLKSIRRILALSRKHNVQVIFYITPIDVETGERLLGKQFREQVLKNATVIKNVISSEKGVVVDLSESLSREYFYWYYDRRGAYSPHEHLLYSGREIVAQQIASAIQKMQSAMTHQ
ncbi:MAG: hypothetical protein KC897_07665 [Candidatus Omnitrophica bacterium]|nr:hypothetical protein [Candidatus Omnitrophota bacterium]MCB9720491.1 hypothetical protein [Candidatus Omnitrophota bacterium]